MMETEAKEKRKRRVKKGRGAFSSRANRIEERGGGGRRRRGGEGREGATVGYL